MTPAFKRQPEPKTIYKDSSTSTLLTVGIVSLLSVGAYFAISKSKDEKNAESEASKLASDIATKQASLLKSYIGSWYQSAKINEIIATARSITNWQEVVKAYSRLYEGSNLEQDLRSALGSSNYAKFISEVSKQGLPGTKTDNIVVKPIETGTKKGDIVFLDDTNYDVVYYKDWRDYPIKKLATVTKGKINPAKRGVTFLQSIEANYVGSPVKTTLYQIRFADGLTVWVNRDRNIARKKSVSGFELQAALPLTNYSLQDIG